MPTHSKNILQKGAFSSILLFLIIFFSGCSSEIDRKLTWLDEKAAEIVAGVEALPEDNLDEVFKKDTSIDQAQANNENKNKNEPVTKNNTKEKINQWIEENNLNRYGDPLDTIYAGGTPLFNEETGEKISRYEYILKNNPNILNN